MGVGKFIKMSFSFWQYVIVFDASALTGKDMLTNISTSLFFFFFFFTTCQDIKKLVKFSRYRDVVTST